MPDRRLFDRLRRTLACLAFLAVLQAGPAQAWWNGDWTNRMRVTADAGPKGANVAEPIGRTQILLRLHSGNFNFATAKEDGSDLRFVAADDRTPLKFHIERFDGLVDQVGLVWVDVPDLAPGGATPFYLYWGNKTATPGGDPKATYDADELLVYHFADENGLPKDVTGYANNALTAGRRDEGGMIGFGLKLDGKGPIRIPASPSLAIPAAQPMTWSIWARPNGTEAATGVLYALRDGANALTVGLDAGVPYAQLETPSGTARTSAAAPITGEGWHLVDVTATDRLTVYLDGARYGEVAATLPAMNGSAVLGGPAAAPAVAPPPAADPAAPASAPAPASASASASAPPPVAAPPSGPAPFVGLIDEFTIAKAARPPGSFGIAFRSEGPQANLLTFDVAEESSVFGSGYVAIIARSVTPDAWVVIGILGVMALMSWWVMGSKAVYVARMSRANRVFRGEFRAAMLRAARERRAGFAEIDVKRRPMLRRSSLHRIYEICARELDDRLQDGRVAPGDLSPQSAAAIRSAVDAGLALELQRLNRLMVLLTIAISGGPFLGLLGTVVGVMITFAAIAAAGDVNVNAIAPGIAAALLATVAGLVVAIPALFGYNYFVTRIRDTSTDMQVFVEELITSMGEGLRKPLARPIQPAAGDD